MVEYIIRQKIYDSFYWKQECFGLTAELLVEKGVELKYVRLSTCFALHMRGAWNACWDLSALQKIRLVHLTRFIGARKSYDGALSKRTLSPGCALQAGGMYGDPQKPAEFLCLILKMLQIQPDKDIIIEFIKDEEFKYLRLLGGDVMVVGGHGRSWLPEK